ncbi:hypothetical protein [Nonomuraea sp. SBT364]|uniref:hypothetical protein n=1 Tax=Nonomuraea sp. SBT364 TaxID=1580530 RepID=UPI0012E291A9|nr:hypothetical protein [Nonomuraea sp. SBT364]
MKEERRTPDGSHLAPRSMFSRRLEDRLTHWSSRTGIAVEVWALPSQPLPGEVADLVQAVIVDTLDHVERHVPTARSLSVALTVAPSGLRLTLGVEHAATAGTRLDAVLLRRRVMVAELGGSLAVNTVDPPAFLPGEPLGGTTVGAWLPAEALRR